MLDKQQSVGGRESTLRELIIDASFGSRCSMRELVSRRELLLLLVWRNFLVRYRQMVIGIAWVIVRPLLTMAVFTVVFGRFARLPVNNLPYPLLVLSGLVPWQFFSDSFLQGSNSLVANAPMVTKIYFPRIFIPASSVICSLIDLGISLLLLLFMMFAYGVYPTISIVLLPFVIAWAFIFTLFLTSVSSAIAVKYRDVRFIVAFIVQIGVFALPIGFSLDVVPQRWMPVYCLNPLVGIIGCFRWALLGETVPLTGVGVSLGVTTVLCIFAWYYFMRTESELADVI